MAHTSQMLKQVLKKIQEHPPPRHCQTLLTSIRLMANAWLLAKGKKCFLCILKMKPELTLCCLLTNC